MIREVIAKGAKNVNIAMERDTTLEEEKTKEKENRDTSEKEI